MHLTIRRSRWCLFPSIPISSRSHTHHDKWCTVSSDQCPNLADFSEASGKIHFVGHLFPLNIQITPYWSQEQVVPHSTGSKREIWLKSENYFWFVCVSQKTSNSTCHLIYGISHQGSACYQKVQIVINQTICVAFQIVDYRKKEKN